MWGNPMFDLQDAAGALGEVLAARKAHPTNYLRVNAFDATRGFETTRLSFIVHRPGNEPGFGLVRQADGRNIRYSIESYATKAPEGRRYE
jgi:ribulose-bisphosphate carboxylase small chain